jgi:hypothetical protein
VISIKVFFEDGNTLVTRINVSLDEAKKYYIGHAFTLDEEKPMVKVVRVEQLTEK